MHSPIGKQFRNAFTLVELVAVMVVLAILAGVAIPKYFDYADRAKTSSVEGTLGGVRSAMASFLADSSIEGEASYPTLDELTTVGTVMQQDIPANPYNGLSTIRQFNGAGAMNNRNVNQVNNFGWNYYVNNDADPPIAAFWANSEEETTKLDANGDPIPANEL